MFRKWLTLAISLSVLAGCGVPAAGNAPDQGMAIQHMHKSHRKLHQKWAEKLGLSQEQKDQIKAIFAEGKEARRAAHKAHWQDMKDILLAETVDEAKLRQHIADHQAARAAKLDDRIDKIAAVRDVLTDEQRTKAAELITEKTSKAHGMHHHRHGRFFERLTADLNLNDEQKAALDALKTAMKDTKEQMRAARAQKWAAIAAFLTSGDKDALRNAMQAIDKPAMPVDEMVAFATSLNLDQRKAIIDKMEKRMAKRCPPRDKDAAMADDHDDAVMADTDEDAMSEDQDKETKAAKPQGGKLEVEVEVKASNNT